MCGRIVQKSGPMDYVERLFPTPAGSSPTRPGRTTTFRLIGSRWQCTSLPASSKSNACHGDGAPTIPST